MEWATHANTLQITVNLKKKRHLRRAFQSFCASWQFNYKCYMLETLGFFHISSKNPVDADIANRKHYSAPAGALTLFFLFVLKGTFLKGRKTETQNITRVCLMKRLAQRAHISKPTCFAQSLNILLKTIRTKTSVSQRRVYVAAENKLRACTHNTTIWWLQQLHM